MRHIIVSLESFRLSQQESRLFQKLLFRHALSIVS